MGYKNFASCGLNIVAAFDNDPKKVGTLINGIEVLAVDKLSDMIRKMHINIGILTVPEEDAQTIAEEMAEGGISAIWNFATDSFETSKKCNSRKCTTYTITGCFNT